MNKKILITSSLLVVILVALSSVLYFSKGNYIYSTETGGNISAGNYDENDKVLESTIEVNDEKLNQLFVSSFIDLNQGDLKYELYAPNGALVYETTVTHKEGFKNTVELEPFLGEWVAKYYINETTNGSYTLRFEGK
ncbi:hypothetical protein ACFOQM_05445 [Paenibacillus sp. GCM10012307]|uniref:Uncharacterized protein n=1 Tax=Paenibacillus roseus TaxID=2798579 RepID=A0A934J0Z5_9BACL|nr:hypothetical protein [Paenibacillus roseus]MBJ6360750.1 hypothetical protein [Paenibacillus roseus]